MNGPNPGVTPHLELLLVGVAVPQPGAAQLQAARLPGPVSIHFSIHSVPQVLSTSCRSSSVPKRRCKDE